MTSDEINNIITILIEKLNISTNIPVSFHFVPDESDLETEQEEDGSFTVEC